MAFFQMGVLPLRTLALKIEKPRKERHRGENGETGKFSATDIGIKFLRSSSARGYPQARVRIRSHICRFQRRIPFSRIVLVDGGRLGILVQY